MPITLTNLEANPVSMEDYPIIGEYIQGGHGTETDFFNARTQSILPGEPVVVFGRLGVSKDVILPGTFGTLVFGPWMSYLLNPALAESVKITQGTQINFDIDLATGLYPGYATNATPTNGYKLGYAVVPHATPAEVVMEAGVPVAADGNSERIFVLLDEAATIFGTVPDNLASS